MPIHFSKMHGIGNDFVVIDATKTPVNLSPTQAQMIADRHYGIGCDQILIIEAPGSDDVLFHYRILNADGSETAQCGNGARCFAHYVFSKGLTTEREIPVSTANGKIILYVEDDEQIRVDMGVPRLQPDEIPLTAANRQTTYTLDIDGTAVNFGAVSMGNPHAVLLVDDVDAAEVDYLGPILESHPSFPERVNVGFMQILSKDHIRLRVYERGTGETLACGSGACAAVVSGQLQGRLNQHVMVDLPGGRLNISWVGESHSVEMTGPAAFVFEGTIKL